MPPLAALVLALACDDYHVDPAGDDVHDGRSPSSAWKTVGKVNATPFRPGDRILFRRGGEWRASLKATSSGDPGKPIVYAAYGEGAKPRFLGSDPLDPSAFKAAGSRFSAPVASRAAAVLVDGDFLKPGAWSWKAGVLEIDVDPRATGKSWTTCVRVDAIHSNRKNHLVFKDLVADATADERDGYGFRVMGSDGVRLEDCEAYRAGRHHFGTINSTNFVGLRLKASQAMPACPGGATFYVSFSDASRKGDRHEWIDCAGERFENGAGGAYQIFYDHGEGMGSILLKGMVSKGGQLTVAGSKECPLRIEGGRLEDHSLVVYGSHVTVDGLEIIGNGAVDLFCSDSVLQNLRMTLRPKHGAWTGYSAAFVVREGSKNNAIRFNTVRMEDGHAVALLKPGSSTRLIANVLLAPKGALQGGPDGLEAGFNAYSSPQPFDRNGVAGDLKLSPEGIPLGGSPLIGAAKVDASQIPTADSRGRARRSTPSIGALEPD